MDTVRDFILHNRTLAIAAVIVLFAAAGMVLRKFRIIAVILVFIGALLLYALIHLGGVKPSDLEKVKERTKAKVMEKIQ